MYILKNAVRSITRNKGRNVLIGLIIVVISISTTVTLAIRNTADHLVDEYASSHELIASISLNRENLTKNFEAGEDNQKENIEKFNDVDSITLDEIKEYGDSEYVKNYYYTYTTSLDSDSLSKATDTYEYEVETSESSSTTTHTPPSGDQGGPGGMGDSSSGGETITNNTTTITKETKEFKSNRALDGDFTLVGYSSYDAMTQLVDGTYKVTSGSIFSSFDSYECVISSELATLNSIEVGDEIELKNSNSSTTYTFTVTGIYESTSDEEDSNAMFSSVANTIITGSDVIAQMAEDDDELTTQLTPSFVLTGEDVIDAFSEEVTSKGLNEYYSVTTNLDELESATETIENVKTFATTFLIITLVIAAVVLFVINMINIRERKYEIGVLRTIGMSKLKLSMQFLLELLLVTMISLSIGAGIGSACAKPVGNLLLENEISNAQSSENEVAGNFGKEMKDMNFENRNGLAASSIESIDASVDLTTICELVGVGIILTILSSSASLIAIQRFSPLSILKERS